MSEYSLMCKYLIVGYHTLKMYYIIDGIYVKTGSLSYLSLFLLLYIYQAGKKKMLGLFDLTKPVQILIKHKSNKIWRVWSKLKHTNPLSEID